MLGRPLKKHRRGRFRKGLYNAPWEEDAQNVNAIQTVALLDQTDSGETAVLPGNFEGPEHENAVVIDDSVEESEDDFVDFVETVEPEENTVLTSSGETRWTFLWAFLMTRGSRSISKQMYSSVRRLYQTLATYCPRDSEHIPPTMPSYSTLLRVIQEQTAFNLLADKREVRMLVDMTKSGARSLPNPNEEDPKARFWVVDPSVYMKMDLSMPSFCQTFVGSSIIASNKTFLSSLGLPHVPVRKCVDHLPIVRARDYFYGPASSIHVDNEFEMAEPSDCLQLILISRDCLEERLCRAFKSGVTEHSQPILKTCIVGIVTIHAHGIEETEPPLSRTISNELAPNADDAEFLKELSCLKLDYTERQNGRPLLRPSDVVALLRPETRASSYMDENTLLTSSDIDLRLLLVHRFWRDTQERRRFCLFVPHRSTANRLNISTGVAFSIMDTSKSAKRVDVECVNVVSRHTKERGIQSYPLLSSVGKLNNHEHYGIYRVILYYDGFQIFDTKSFSGEGLYMACLNTATEGIRSNDIRTLALVPPGISADQALSSLIDDLVEGAVEGFVVTDAFGIRRRMFIDVVGVVGDTPALNSTLDVRGHTAKAPCHLCAFVRGADSALGSRYSASTIHSKDSAARRSFAKQQSVRLETTDNTTLQSLGIRTSGVGSDGFLFKLRSKLSAARQNRLRQLPFQAVTPCIFDPYQGCFIGPDHLLCGHIKDCINAAFSLLNRRQHRVSIEKAMMTMLNCLGFTAQNSLFHIEKRVLHSMKMSELYEVATVAENAFLTFLSVHSSETFPAILSDVISLIGSSVEICGMIWARDDRPVGWDTKRKTVNQMRRCIIEHLQLVTKICAPDDRETPAVRNRGRGSGRFRKRARRACQNEEANPDDFSGMNMRERVLSNIDKPNVHRLLEFVCSILPMVGNARMIAELPFERNHKQLKQAIRNSNKKEPHLQAMRSSIFNDWQRRLFSAASKEDNCTMSHLATARILTGRHKEVLNETEILALRTMKLGDVFGPNRIVVRELQAQYIQFEPFDLCRKSSWLLASPTTVPASLANRYENVVRMCSDIIESECIDLTFYNLAYRQQEFRLKQWHKIKRGNVIRVLVGSKRQGRIIFGEVECLFTVKSVPIAIMRLCLPASGADLQRLQILKIDESDRLQAVELTSNITVHPKVTMDDISTPYTTFRLLTELNSYPPRSA